MSTLSALDQWNEQLFTDDSDCLDVGNRMRDELVAEIESLKCCGNCKHAGSWYMRQSHYWAGSCGAGAHSELRFIRAHDRCHFTPSRWKRKT